MSLDNLALGGHFARELSIPWRAEQPPDPHLVALNDLLANELGLDPASLRTSDGLGLLTGARLPSSSTPVAQAYAGHQFSSFAPRLGDGRALLLGELADPAGGSHRPNAEVAGDMSPFGVLLQVVTAPYDERPGLDRYTEPAPDDFGTYRTFCGT